MKLSIITINRNNAIGLRKTIESVVRQTNTQYEYIVIDGGSTDESVDIIREYSNNIHHWVSEPDKGIYNAMNKGITKAHGEYCLFLNSGDWLYDSSVVDGFNRRGEADDILYGNVVLANEQGDFTKLKYHRFVPYDLIVGTIVHQVIFFRKDLFSRIGSYDESFKIAADWKICIEAVFKYKCSIKHIDAFISYYDQTGVSSKMLDVDAQERSIVLKSLFSDRVIADYESILLLDITGFFYDTSCLIQLLYFLVSGGKKVMTEDLESGISESIRKDYIYYRGVQRILSIPYYRSLYYLVRKIAMNRIKRHEISIYY
jgi:glycosyltransferase involved in cell wall biosynthesis